MISFESHFEKIDFERKKINVAELCVISCKGQIRLNSRVKDCGELRNSFLGV